MSNPPTVNLRCNINSKHIGLYHEPTERCWIRLYTKQTNHFESAKVCCRAKVIIPIQLYNISVSGACSSPSCISHGQFVVRILYCIINVFFVTVLSCLGQMESYLIVTFLYRCCSVYNNYYNYIQLYNLNTIIGSMYLPTFPFNL